MLEEETYNLWASHEHIFTCALRHTHKYVHTTYMCAHTQMEVTFESH